MSIRRRRESNRDGDVPPSSVGTDLNFAQRLLMANENAVTNIADLWVAAAINADNEDPFESEDDGEVDEWDEDAQELGGFPSSGDLLQSDIFSPETGVAPSGGELEGTTVPSTPVLHTNRFMRTDSFTPLSIRSLSKRPSVGFGSPRPSSSAHPHRVPFTRHVSITSVEEGNSYMYRRSSSTIPPIFAHTGVRTPPAVLEAQLQQFADEPAEAEGEALAPIIEGQQSQTQPQVEQVEKEPSLMSLLPVLVIMQYGLLALHATTHDQVFYLYLVS